MIIPFQWDLIIKLICEVLTRAHIKCSIGRKCGSRILNERNNNKVSTILELIMEKIRAIQQLYNNPNKKECISQRT